MGCSASTSPNQTTVKGAFEMAKISTKPGHEVVNVTPELAKQWLLLNKHNRKLKQIKIGHYARDMREGNWRFTGEAIKFNKLGDLVDGQNRLHAVIDSGATVPMLVVTGLDENAQEAMDSGAIRSAGDALAFRGHGYTNVLASTARIHYLWANGMIKHCMSNPGSEQYPTTSQVVAYVEDHPRLAQAAQAAGMNARLLWLPTSSIGVSFYEFALIDPDDTVEFFDRIKELRTEGKGDPVSTLVKRCREMRDRRERVRPATGLFMIMRAWNAVRSGEYFEKFQFGSEYRGWTPIPQPK
jgi:hypothetical protein